jgi:hypothetical protein
MMDDKQEFLWNVHSYTNEYIRFADTKAAVVVAWSSAIIGALASQSVQNRFLDIQLRSADWLNAGTALLAFILTAAGFLISLYVVFPRLTKGGKPHDTDLVFWEHVRAFDSAAAYSHAIEQQKDLSLCLSRHVYVIAEIARKKYWWLRVAICSTAIGTFLSLVELSFK